MNTKLSSIRIILLFLTLFAAARAVQADDIYWTNTAGGNWSVPANWSTGTLPGTNDNVFIVSNGTYTVTVDVSAAVSNLTVGGSSGTQTLTINANALTVNGTGSISTNGVLNLSGGNLGGVNTVTGTLNWTDGYVVGALTVLSNGVLNITGNGTKSLAGPLTNAGSIYWSGTGFVYVYTGSGNTGRIENQAGALFEVQSDSGIFDAYNVGNTVFDNAGIFRKTGGTPMAFTGSNRILEL